MQVYGTIRKILFCWECNSVTNPSHSKLKSIGWGLKKRICLKCYGGPMSMKCMSVKGMKKAVAGAPSAWVCKGRCK